MDEKQMEFRVGVFVAIATCIAAFMVFNFSDLSEQFRSSSTLTVHFREAGGLHSSSPVRMSGIQIGSVRDIKLDETNGGVLVELAILEQFTIRQGSQPRITSSVLGDSAIDFSSGVGTEPIDPATIIPGVAATGPLESIEKLEDRVGRALDVFTQTGREWGRVGASMNQAVSGTDGKQMNRVMNATLASLEEFTRTMRTASRTLQSAQGVLADSSTQNGLRETLDAMPKLVNDTRQAIQAVRVTVQRVDRNMQHLDTAIQPIAANSKPMASRLNNTLANLETLSGELAHFSKMLRTRDGSVQRLVSDPSLYRNLNSTAASLAVFLKNAEPVISDLRIFSDKIARHPELIGVRGAFRGSSGIKQTDYQERKRQ